MSIFTLFFKINLFTSSSTIWAKEEQDNKAGLKDKILFGFLIETAFSRPVYQEKHFNSEGAIDWSTEEMVLTYFHNPFPTYFYRFLKDNVQL